MRYQQAISKPPTHRACTAVFGIGPTTSALQRDRLKFNQQSDPTRIMRRIVARDMLCNSAGADMTITAGQGGTS